MFSRADRQTEHRQRYIERVRQARCARFRSQAAFLVALGDVPQTTWKTYETHVAMPMYLIPQFCAICDVDANWLLTGHGKAPVLLVPPRKPRAPRLPALAAAMLKTAR